MRRSLPAIIACFVALLLAGGLTEAAPTPGCKLSLSELTELETSLKREIKIPFDASANPLKGCDITQPAVEAANRAGKPSIAIFVFDVTSTGRVVGLQLIGAAWSEARLFELARGYEGLTSGADWRDLEPAQLASAADPVALTPADRARALAGASR